MDRRYRAVYAKLLLEHMKQGRSLKSFAALETNEKGPVAPATVTSWVKRHNNFAQAYERGKAAALLFFEQRLLRTKQKDGPDPRALLAVYRSHLADMAKDETDVVRNRKSPAPKRTQRHAVIGPA